MTDVVQKRWGFCHTLRHDRSDNRDCLVQIPYEHFLKMAEGRRFELLPA